MNILTKLTKKWAFLNRMYIRRMIKAGDLFKHFTGVFTFSERAARSLGIAGVLIDFADMEDLNRFERISSRHGWKLEKIINRGASKRSIRGGGRFRRPSRSNRSQRHNPIRKVGKPVKEIYDTVESIEAIKGDKSLWPGERFRHDFEGDSRASVYGLDDGSLLIKSKAGRRLWKDFDYDETEVRQSEERLDIFD